MLPPSELCQRIRIAVKERAAAVDVVWLLRWLLTHYQDDGKLRSPQMPRRKSIVLDGIKYVLIRIDKK